MSVLWKGFSSLKWHPTWQQGIQNLYKSQKVEERDVVVSSTSFRCLLGTIWKQGQEQSRSIAVDNSKKKQSQLSKKKPKKKKT
jgi:hypothetical protein